MKKVVLLALVAFAACAAFAFDTESIEPASRVNSYTKTDYAVISKFGEYFRTPTVKHIHSFKNGKEVEVASYTVKKASGSAESKEMLVDKTVFAYNAAGKLESASYYDSSEKLIWKSVKEYGADGTIASESEYNADNVLAGKTIYKYETGKVTESYYNGAGALLERIVTKLDTATGRPVEEFLYFADGNLDRLSLTRYTDDGKISQVEVWEGAGHPSSKKCYVYERTTGAVKEIQSFDGQGNLFERVIYNNDAKGNPQKVYKYSVSRKFGEVVNELKFTADYSFGN
ncbi:MAG TPA: hypothetical protein DCP61_02165 [Treponema sp.]|nr:hypothetical protein [Treponema sp.]